MDNFFTNIDLVAIICKYLNYEEQFVLCQVASELRNIIANYVWKTKFKEMSIIMSETAFLVSDRTMTSLHSGIIIPDIWQKHCILLTDENIEIFLKLNINNIEKLQLIAEKEPQEDCDDSCIWNVLPFYHKYPNLTELCCWYLNLLDMDLQAVAENCLKLQSLAINYQEHYDLPIEIATDYNIQSIKDMHNLKKLIINTKSYEISISNSKDFINQLKLQQLRLDCGVIKNSASNISELNLSNLKYYKKLHINCGVLYKPDFLQHFENLCHLTISDYSRSYGIDEEFFDVLLKSCKSLTRLHLMFCTIKHFKALPTLNELILERCDGLSYSNLKTILSEMQLKCFKTIWTKYRIFENFFYISPSLETLEISIVDSNIMNLLMFNEKNHTNLKKIHYILHNVICYEKLLLSNFAKNLKILNINGWQLWAEDCLKLKYLEKIKVFQIEISEFLLLLKHENIRELSISEIYTVRSGAELKVFETNLRYLRLEWNVIENITDFLLDLLDFNRRLSLAFHIELDDRFADLYDYKMPISSITDPLISLLSNRKFPKRFKNINVCGVSMDCDSIRNHCPESMEKISILVSCLSNSSTPPYFLLQ